jgi:hypothetical protein
LKRFRKVASLNGPFLFKEGGNPAEYKAGLELAIGRGWLWQHESGTYVKSTPAGADLHHQPSRHRRTVPRD